MTEAEEKLKRFLDNAIKKRHEPLSQAEKRKQIHKRLQNEKRDEKKKFGL